MRSSILSTLGRYALMRLQLWARGLLPPYPPADLPRPIHEGCIGGIESIVIDGKRWFFGFDYRMDVVLTPLIGDADAMAALASRHMLQTDGVHGRRYWRVLVEEAIADSALTGNDASRTFSSAEFRRIASDLAAAEAGDRPIPGLAIEYHLLYVLAAAVGDVPPPDDPAYVSIVRRLGAEPDAPMPDALCAAEMLAGTRDLPEGITYGDAAGALRACLAALVNRAPGNWRTLFQDLAP
jgi:hypothetical protein